MIFEWLVSVATYIQVKFIKTHGSESQGQEEAACMRVFWPTVRDHCSELFTQMAALKFVNAVTQPLLQYRLLNYRPSTFQLSRINKPKLK